MCYYDISVSFFLAHPVVYRWICGLLTCAFICSMPQKAFEHNSLENKYLTLSLGWDIVDQHRRGQAKFELMLIITGVIGSDVPWLECPACNALTWVITVTE